MRFVQMVVGIGVLASAFCAIAAELAPVQHLTVDGPYTVVALDNGSIICFSTSGSEVVVATYPSGQGAWPAPTVVITADARVQDVAAVVSPRSADILLFTVEPSNETGNARQIVLRRSADRGATWSAAFVVHRAESDLRLGGAATTGEDSIILGFAEDGSGGDSHIRVLSGANETWKAVTIEAGTGAASPPSIMVAGGGIAAYFTREAPQRRYIRVSSHDGSTWGPVEAINLASATPNGEPQRTLSLLERGEDVLVGAATADVIRPGNLSVVESRDGGRTWPVRRVLASNAVPGTQAIISPSEGAVHIFYRETGGGVVHQSISNEWATDPGTLDTQPKLDNVAPPVRTRGRRGRGGESQVQLPVADVPTVEHVGAAGSEDEWKSVKPPAPSMQLDGVQGKILTPMVTQGGRDWVGADDGLYSRDTGSTAAFSRHPSYGVDGPPASKVAGLVVDSRGTLWAATPAGLGARNAEGQWRAVLGRDGLPWLELIAIAIDDRDRLWVGSTRGLIQYLPYVEGRQWFYRAGKRYLPDDKVLEVAITKDGRSVLARTAAGIGRIDEVEVTLFDKAEFLEKRFNERHRRLGLPSPARFSNPERTEWTHGPQPSDGLWASYHVAAMGMAYSLTLEERYRESASASMEALYLLQNVTGITGLVARTVVSVDEPAAAEAANQENWLKTDDGKYLWRDDVSSDQIDGHFLAFYTYFEHIAQFDPAERERIEKQIRQVTDYILGNNYQIIDWDGERTLWGWWNPELLNDDPDSYLESGLYSLMMLSFLRTAHYITGDDQYLEHFHKLIQQHDYLSNILLEKKLFPDELNHSDDQLSAVAYYPILQLEYDPLVRNTLHRAAQRHAIVELPERNSLFTFTYATIDPAGADVAGCVETLREMPRDRRDWKMDNADRTDVVIARGGNRGGDAVLLDLLPADERHFERWNQDPYEATGGGDGMMEGSGEHYLFPYWMGRYHGLIAPPGEAR